jgi:hypothetical protein
MSPIETTHDAAPLSDFPPLALSATTRGQILKLLKRLKPQHDLSGFIVKVEVLLGEHAFQQKYLTRIPLPIQIQRQLKRHHNAMRTLREQLDALVQNKSCFRHVQIAAVSQSQFRRLFPAGQGNTTSKPAATARSHVKAATAALAALEQLFVSAMRQRRRPRNTKGGRPSNPRQLAFVRDVCALYAAHFGKPGPTTAEGPFEELVGLLLHQIGWPSGDLHKLLLKARRAPAGGKTPSA